jgi:transketolase
MALEPLRDKFASFGYEVKTTNGNSIPDLVCTFEKLPFNTGKPSLILAQTVKGKGISFTEDQVNWHHHVPSDEEFSKAIEELNQAEMKWREQYDNVHIG